MNVKIEGLEKDKLNPRKFGGLCSRSTVILNRAAVEKIDEGIPAIATTAAPALVWDWKYDNGWGGIVREILPMRYAVMPDNDKGPLIDSHDYSTIHNDLGYGYEWQTNEDQLLCKLFVSSVETNIRTKIEEKVIDSLSLDYETYEDETVEIPKGAEVFVDGIRYANDFNDDYPLLVRTLWKPKGLSLIIFGADDAAKITRAMQNGIKADDPELQKLLNTILANQKSLIEINSKKEANMPDPKNPDPQEPKVLSHAETAERDKPTILEFGEKKFGGKYKPLAETAVRAGMTAEQFNVMIMDAIENERGGNFETPGSKLGLTGNEIQEYSLSRAVKAKLDKTSCKELEMSQQIEKNLGRSVSDGRNFYTPFEANLYALRKHPAMKEYFKRAHSAGVPSEGGDYIATMLHDELLVEFLHNASVTGQLGCTFLTGLRENFSLPKVVSGLSVQSTAENTAPDVSYIVAGLANYTPKVIAGYTEYGKNLFYRSSVAIDTLLFNELNASLNDKVDDYAINGTGSSNEPFGLLSTEGIPSLSLSTLGWRKVNTFAKLMKKSKLSVDPAKFGMSVDVELELKTSLKSQYGSNYLMENGQVAGYPGVSSNFFADQVLAYGLWNQLYILMWGNREIMVDPYTKAGEWMVKIFMHDMMDIMVRRNSAFVISDDVVLQED